MIKRLKSKYVNDTLILIKYEEWLKCKTTF